MKKTPPPSFTSGMDPHEGRELELMLMGEKKAALFADFVNRDGTANEAAIPERAFAPHIEAGRIKRFSTDRSIPNLGRVYRTVVFTLPTEAWRAGALMWLQGFHDDHAHLMTGRILGYSEPQIAAYLEFQSSTVHQDIS
ncbi:MAG: hypothetical protein H6865_01635 [Rhodospirillales bacterium]|nr:hypothetical protein [Alphaproteobacteria bacterium]MCB9986320.1 hypothetical protein [Rhodospirillales bacterium]USO07129.1 MAG: hypothetical protein H6866_06750 [Rhodospirillales bacterium]